MSNTKFQVGQQITVQIGNPDDDYGYITSTDAKVMDVKIMPWGGEIYLLEREDKNQVLRATVKKGSNPSTDMISTCAVSTTTRTREEAIEMIW